MGKASKKKSDRRMGIGPPRTEIESTVRQEQVKRRLIAALNQPGQVGDTLRQAAGQAAAAQAAADDAVTGLWGGATPVPAEVPQWEDGSLGDFFFTEPVIAGAAAAPPAAMTVMPAPQRMLAYGSAREAVAAGPATAGPATAGPATAAAPY
jgi:hypothetical protein